MTREDCLPFEGHEVRIIFKDDPCLSPEEVIYCEGECSEIGENEIRMTNTILYRRSGIRKYSCRGYAVIREIKSIQMRHYMPPEELYRGVLHE